METISPQNKHDTNAKYFGEPSYFSGWLNFLLSLNLRALKVQTQNNFLVG